MITHPKLTKKIVTLKRELLKLCEMNGTFEVD